MIKFIHFADLHLGMENYGKTDPNTGLNSRLFDFLHSFDQIIDFAIKNKVDYVFFAGDAYKNREPSPTYQRALAERIFRLSQNNIQTILLVGNHDTPYQPHKANTLDIFSALKVPNVQVVREPKIIIRQLADDNLQIACLPWLSRLQLLEGKTPTASAEKMEEFYREKLQNILKELIKKINKKNPSMLLFHGSIEGSTYGSERSVMLGQDIILPKNILKNSPFSYIACGHLHQFQEVLKNPPTIYSDSIERIDFGEEKEKKGFIYGEITDHKIKWDFMPLAVRPFVTIVAKIKNTDEPLVKLKKEIDKKKIKDAVVKVEIEGPGEKLSLIRESMIIDLLKDAFFIAGISKNSTDSQKITEGFSDTITHTSYHDWLKTYWTQKGIAKNKIEKLTQMIDELLEESR